MENKLPTPNKDNCPLEARFTLPWAGKLMKMCMIHANGLVVVANAIGYPIEIEEIKENNIQCMGPNDLEKYEGTKHD